MPDIIIHYHHKNCEYDGDSDGDGDGHDNGHES